MDGDVQVNENQELLEWGQQNGKPKTTFCFYGKRFNILQRLEDGKALVCLKNKDILIAYQFKTVWFLAYGEVASRSVSQDTETEKKEVKGFKSAPDAFNTIMGKIFEKLDEALAKSLQTNCDLYNTGIHIIAIRVTKPRIPEAVRRNYEAVETAKTELLVQLEKEKVAKAEENTILLRARMTAQKDSDVAVIQANKEASVSIINAEKEMKQKEVQKRSSEIDAEIELLKRKVETDSYFYQITKQAEANKLLYTEEYLRALLYQSLANNTKIFFGEKIPSIFLDLIPKSDKIGFP